MTIFDETRHARDTAGRFAEMAGSEQIDALDVSLTDTSADWETRAHELQVEYFELWSDRGAGDRVYEIGELDSRQADIADVCTDPAMLAILAGNTIGRVGSAVARNPHTPAAVLHYIATDEGAARAYEDRVAALFHPHTEEATLRAIFNAEDIDRVAGFLRRELARVPATPSDIVTALHEKGIDYAGEHPNLHDDVLATSVADPELARSVIRNPKLNDAQLKTAMRVTAVHDFDDEDITAVVVAAAAARHPNVSDDTLRALTNHPDHHVRKTARERILGDLMQRSRAAAEAEMREAGGTDDEIHLAGDIAEDAAFRGREWGHA